MAIELPQPFEQRVQNVGDEELAVRGQTRDELRAYYERRVLDDQAKSPAVGSEAPDVALEVLSADGKRTGESRSLSSFRGRPVGLVFGSFT